MAAALPTGEYINVMDTETITISSNQALIIEYKGDNNKSAGAHQAMDEYMLDHYLENLPPVTEEYLTDPAKESDPSKWSTNIIYYVQAKIIFYRALSSSMSKINFKKLSWIEK